MNRILRNVIPMERLAEARAVQLKNSGPLSLPRRSRAESRQLLDKLDKFHVLQNTSGLNVSL